MCPSVSMTGWSRPSLIVRGVRHAARFAHPIEIVIELLYRGVAAAARG